VLNISQSRDTAYTEQAEESFRLTHDKVIRMKSPRLRYTVGKISQRIAVPLKKILPSRLFESIISGNFQAN
jgi:hypothetical protein